MKFSYSSRESLAPWMMLLFQISEKRDIQINSQILKIWITIFLSSQANMEVRAQIFVQQLKSSPSACAAWHYQGIRCSGKCSTEKWKWACKISWHLRERSLYSQRENCKNDQEDQRKLNQWSLGGTTEVMSLTESLWHKTSYLSLAA